jgi:hypothetical protein
LQDEAHQAMAFWRIILTPGNRPFAVMSLEPGSGLTDREPPDGLVEHVETLFGKFDEGACLSPEEFSAVGYRDMHWPPPEL